MQQLALLFLVMLCTIVVVPVARRLGLPYPVLLTVLGLAMALIPWVPDVEIDPELILPLALPPLLYAASQRSSWRQFTANIRPILLLAVALVLVTTVAVTAVATSFMPGVTLASAVVLGALVSPPDPVAATAVAGSLGLPRRLVSILEGEGLFNDVTALVVYGVAVEAVVTGSFSAPHAALEFLLSAGVAVAVGLALGWLALKLMGFLADSTLQTGLSLVVPFLAYTLTDEAHGSGVLAVLVCSLYLAQHANDPDDVDGRLSARAFWEVAELLVTGIAFTLIGLELSTVREEVENGWRELLGPALLVAGTVVAVRLLWLLPTGWISRRLHGRDGRDHVDEEIPMGWREMVVVWWSGMRGVATIALALAVPLTTEAGTGFPGRPEILFTALVVVMVTLVLQGLTLPWVVKSLGVVSEGEQERAEERRIARRAAKAALRRLRAVEAVEELPDELVERLRRQHTELLAALSPDAADEEQRRALKDRAARIARLREIDAEMQSAARREVLAARAEPGTDPEVADRVLRRLDLKSFRR